MTNFKKMIFGWYILLKRPFSRKSQRREWQREKLIMPFRLLVHPVATFSDLKFENQSSFFLANVLMVVYILQNMLTEVGTGWMFNPNGSFSVPLLLVRTFGVVLMWTVCNWAMCTLTEGEGKMQEIWIALCYSLLPSILFGFISLFASHVLSLDESIIHGFLQSFGMAWTLLLAFLGMMVMHQYTVLKTLLSVLYTAVCAILALFLIFLFFSIAQQLWSFIQGLAQEFSYRQWLGN